MFWNLVRRVVASSWLPLFIRLPLERKLDAYEWSMLEKEIEADKLAWEKQEQELAAYDRQRQLEWERELELETEAEREQRIADYRRAVMY